MLLLNIMVNSILSFLFCSRTHKFKDKTDIYVAKEKWSWTWTAHATTCKPGLVWHCVRLYQKYLTLAGLIERNREVLDVVFSTVFCKWWHLRLLQQRVKNQMFIFSNYHKVLWWQKKENCKIIERGKTALSSYIFMTSALSWKCKLKGRRQN